jgi:hypothetical protein
MPWQETVATGVKKREREARKPKKNKAISLVLSIA